MTGSKKTPAKKSAEPEPPPPPEIGDKVIPERSDTTYVITRIRDDGGHVDLNLPGTYLDRFNVDVATLRFVERVPRISAKPERDTGNIAQRVATIKGENLQRLDDDIAILMKYLKSEGAPKGTIDALEALSSEQHESWQKAVNRIGRLIKE